MGDTLRAGTDNEVCLRRPHRRSPTTFRESRTVSFQKPKAFYGLATAYAKVGEDMVLYLAVTPDKYELPLYVAESAREMAAYLGVSEGAVYKMVLLHRRYDQIGRKKSSDRPKLMRISVEEDEPTCEMCGKPFARRQHQQIYCSPTCRKAMAYQIIKEKEGKDP
jgi:ribosomal protein L37AE/L43A